MIYLKIKGTLQQINAVLEKHCPGMVDVLTFPSEPQTYYLTINEPNEDTAKLIVDLSLANIAMMGAIKEMEMKQVFLRKS